MAEEIDNEFPFLQVHRNVGAKAASLAPRAGVTYQHARGALDVFWEGLADRRLLRGIPELVLTESDVRTRLELAFGKPVEPALLVSLTLLEVREGGFKVSGMSRYIVAEATRLKKKGPPGGTPAAPLPDPLPTPVPPGSHLNATEVPPGSHPGGTQTPPRSDPTEERGKRKERRDEREDFTGDGFFAWTQETRVDRGAVREAPPARGLSAWFSEAMMEVGGDLDRLKAGWLVYLTDPYWHPRKNPWAGWLMKWRESVPAKAVGSVSVATCIVCGESLTKGVCGTDAVPLCWAHWHEAQEWCASQRIDMWEQGGLEKWNAQRLS